MTFSIKKLVEKLAKKGIQIGLAWLGSLGLTKWGITVDIDPAKVTAIIFLGLEALRNFLKIKFPKVFFWL